MLSAPKTVRLRRDQVSSKSGSGCEIIWLDSVDSTNEWALRESGQGRVLPFVCFADSQSNGRGRGGKRWLSPPDSNIYMSLACKISLPVSEIGLLSIMTGLAVVRVLEQIGIRQVKLKWPNDVVVNDRKIAGILIETRNTASEEPIVVIGVGLNYHWPEEFVESPDQPWIDVVTAVDGMPDGGRDFLAGLLLEECLAMCESFPGDNTFLLNEYRVKYDACLNRCVNVKMDDGSIYQGVATGVADGGGIRVNIDGVEHEFSSAEISISTHSGKN